MNLLSPVSQYVAVQQIPPAVLKENFSPQHVQKMASSMKQINSTLQQGQIQLDNHIAQIQSGILTNGYAHWTSIITGVAHLLL